MQITPAEIADIESRAYPEFMCSMGGAETWADIAEYAECGKRRLKVYGKPEHWYAIAQERKKSVYVADLACVPEKVPPIWTIIRLLLKLANGRPLYCEARESTSWPLIQRLVKRGQIRCTVLDEWNWGGNDRMIECKILAGGN